MNVEVEKIQGNFLNEYSIDFTKNKTFFANGRMMNLTKFKPKSSHIPT